MSEYRLSEINIYPVKSLGGISLTSAEVEKRGLKYDRRFLLVDEENMFLTQRVYPAMALLKTSLSDSGIEINDIRNNEKIIIPFKPEAADLDAAEVTIWNDTVRALHVSGDFDKWFSDALKTKCRLVYMPDDSKRLVDKEYAKDNEIVSFSDGFPFLIIGQESLNYLNSKLLTEKLPMNRFRPNFVFTGGLPHDEDIWNKFMIGSITFRAVKPCARCIITTVNQLTAEKGKEPLRTMAEYRTIDNKVLFGQNLLQEAEGTVSVGDELKIISLK